jgi:hypothetical protein
MEPNRWQFTIRDWLWWTLILAIPLGYWIIFNEWTTARLREVEGKSQTVSPVR